MNKEPESFSKRINAISYAMNEKFCSWVSDYTLVYTIDNLKRYFSQFLSVAYDKLHDNRFIDLKLRNVNKKYPALVISIDADTQPNNALEIQFALFVFMEEWYADFGFSDICLEWV